ncbi:MAG TPA: vanadium-dependent haloperoxidase [Edaphobacter sp.]
MRHPIYPLRLLRIVLVAIFAAFTTTGLHADEVTDWVQIMLQAGHTAGTAPIVMTRNAAIVEASVFDAVNGIKGHYQPIHVVPDAPKKASAQAAAVQAAYVSLVNLYPTQSSTFDAARTASLNAILDEKGGGKEQEKRKAEVAAGVAWGQQVADAIWAWRSTDGFTPNPPPFNGGTAVGEWRPTPPAFAPGVFPQFAYMTPWVISTPRQFRPAGPPALTSALYAKVFNETKNFGKSDSSVRTDEETNYAKFWGTSTVTYNWNSVAIFLGAERHMSLLDNARLFAELNVAIADGAIAVWDAKYHYVFWRPVTAIPLADTDGNPATIADPTWLPLITTPSHPEYPSAHSTLSGAAATVLAHFFGEDSSFVVPSDALPGVVRSFTSFSAAQDEIENARVFGGIHYRTSTHDGRALGATVGKYVIENAFQRFEKGEHDDEEDD